jgi:acetylornithine deacetylase/succinyl-diaminopimelate desuccinylase-like protein
MFDPLEKLKEYIRCQSVSTDSGFGEGMARCRDFVSDLLGGIGLDVEVVQTPLHPIILAKRRGDPAWPHVVIYGHYDVQPPDPVDLWTTPPFEPTERDGRLYGRGAADNKGPFMVHVAAVASLLENHPDFPLRITFLVEGEEEIGSPSFEGFLDAYADQLAGDFVLLSDTASPTEDQIVITSGLRGIITLEAELTGASGDFHSGMHGGAFLNPIQALTRLCASLHDEDGRVNIEGFYDDIIEVEPWELDELSRMGTDEEQYREFLGIRRFRTLDGASPFEGIRFYPTLEFNGIGGGYQGEGSKTVIPSSAFVKISCRLVANQDLDRIEKLVVATLEERCPNDVILKVTPGHKGHPYLVVPPGRPNTPADQSVVLARAFEATIDSVERVFGRPPLFLREGGSVPIIPDIRRVLGMDSVMLGLCLPEDRLHAPNESLHLGVMKKAIHVSKDILKSVASGR